MRTFSTVNFKAFLTSAAVVVLTAGASFAVGSEPEYIGTPAAPRLEFALGGGSVKPTGYLTTSKSLGSYNFAFNLYAPKGLFAFEFGGFNGNHDTPEFGFAANQKFFVDTFAWMSYIEAYSHEALSAYLGIGLAQVSVSQREPDYRNNYGTFIWAGFVRYQICEKWSLQFKTQWFDVTQKANNIETSFQMWNNTLGVGYQWR